MVKQYKYNMTLNFTDDIIGRRCGTVGMYLYVLSILYFSRQQCIVKFTTIGNTRGEGVLFWTMLIDSDCWGSGVYL